MDAYRYLEKESDLSFYIWLDQVCSDEFVKFTFADHYKTSFVLSVTTLESKMCLCLK